MYSIGLLLALSTPVLILAQTINLSTGCEAAALGLVTSPFGNCADVAGLVQ